MPRLEPLDLADCPEESRHALELAQERLGFVPNSLRILARKPKILEAFSNMAHAAWAPGGVEPYLKGLVAHITSRSAGCVYCSAHTAGMAIGRGSEAEKIEHVWEYETSELFSDAERAALRGGAARGPQSQRRDRRGLCRIAQSLDRRTGGRDSRRHLVVRVSQPLERHVGDAFGERPERPGREASVGLGLGGRQTRRGVGAAAGQGRRKGNSECVRIRAWTRTTSTRPRVPYPSRGSRASPREGNWAGTPARFPAAGSWSAAPALRAASFPPLSATCCLSGDCTRRRR